MLIIAYGAAGMLILALFTIWGDHHIKLSTMDGSLIGSHNFWIGAGIYAMGAFGWYFAMKYLSLAAVAVIYSTATIIGLVLLGYLVHNEPMTTRKIAGIALAVSAVVVIGE